MAALYRRWWGAVLGYCFALGLGYLLLRLPWPPGWAQRWAILAAAASGYQLWMLRRFLPLNHRDEETRLLPTLGLGSALTLIRGLAAGLLAGFIFLPRPTTGLLAWLPAGLFTIFSLLDYFDGYVARLTNHATRLGQELDGLVDVAGVFIGTTLVVWYGQLPLWYLFLSAPHELFVFGLRRRQRRGKPVYPLPESNLRRLTAGFHMAFLSVMLWPIFSPPVTSLVGVIFAIPLIGSFGRDWLVVSGRVDEHSTTYQRVRRKLKDLIFGWLPALLRLVVVGMSFGYLLPLVRDHAHEWLQRLWPGSPMFRGEGNFLELLILLAAAGLAVGLAGRIAALGLLIPIALLILNEGLQLQNGALLTATLVLLLAGSGQFSLWQPEEVFLSRRGGEKPPV